MNTRQLYERVQIVAPMGERLFFDRLNDTLIELGSLYGEVPKLLYAPDEDGNFPDGVWIKDLDAELSVLPLYHASIPDNILYLTGAGEEYKQEFLRKAHDAWLMYWNRDAWGRRVKSAEKGACKCGV